MAKTSDAPDPRERVAAVLEAVQRVVRGKDEVVEVALVGVLAGGHLLVEDIPGVGKTTLASTLARALGGTFRRVQCTSDLLPADLLGVNVLDPRTGEFRFRPGPLFAHVVLADELNRCSPRTQSALMEAMAERSVTVDGETRPLPRPFVVMATQNPFDLHGTFPLPDSQLDRFLLRLSMGYPAREAERAILRSGGLAEARLEAVLTPEQVMELVGVARSIRIHDEVEDYLLALVDRTRRDDRLLRGVSTRGAESLLKAARALALVRGRDYVVPEDLQELALAVWAHRVLVRSDDGSGDGAVRALREILWEVPAPA
jgi:MoxR-like ATPase